MRVVICPDKFAGTLSAVEAARAIADGWHSAAPGDELVLRPVADGGPGFLEVLHASLGGWLIEVPTTDPLGRPVTGHILLVGETAYVESADATGLHHLAPDERDPKVTTSYGLGALVRAAAERANRIVIGLGGSATNDGGYGFLRALASMPPSTDMSDLSGKERSSTGRLAAGDVADGLAAGDVADGLAAGDVADGLAAGDVADEAAAGRDAPAGWLVAAAGSVRGVELVAASDVDNPLTGPQGASAVYGPQKGATPSDVDILDARLARWARALERDLPGCPRDLARQKGGGAAGGLGAAVLALGGKIISGITLVLVETGLKEEIARSGIVITGEGSFDHQSLRGKVIAGVAGAAQEAGVPCVVLAGRVTTGRREQGAAGVTEAHSLVAHFGSVDQAMAEPARGLSELAHRLARQYSR